MHSDYLDIIAAVTDGLRFRHLRVADIKPPPYPECTAHRIGHCECRAMPLWWDENGVPRWGAHHPSLCPDIYANEVVLLQIGCQNCKTEFSVQMSRSSTSSLGHLARALHTVEELTGTQINVPASAYALQQKQSSLAEQIRRGSIHYGDPPNADCCPAGPTMNCDDLRVLEFWERSISTSWTRVAELEIELPDAKDTER